VSGAAHILIGTPVVGTDSPLGHVQRVIIDPDARTLTHLEVEPAHSRAGGRLVPTGLVDAVANEIRLRCSHEEFLCLLLSDLTEIVGPGNVRFLYDPGAQTPIQIGGLQPGFSDGPVVHKEVTDIVPTGEVEAHRNEPIYTTDGMIGSVQGFSVDLAASKLTHVLLAEGLLWGKKLVAIPMGEVTTMEGGIGVRLTRQQVKDLPVADLHLA
jgi:sporulation protein YlmC with PRC-barrel domain